MTINTTYSGAIMKFQLKKKASKLRRSGWSVKDIAKELKISESTASLWCREIILTSVQKMRLEKRTGKKLQIFFELVESQKKLRQKRRETIISSAFEKVGGLSNRELFIAGVALYWAEGFKHISEKRIGFCNSDPLMLRFQMKFLSQCMGVKKEEFTARLSLNEKFKSETDKLEKFWAEFLELNKGQFTKPFYQKSKTIKDYGNSEGYKGVLRIHVKKSSVKMLEMRGYLKGLAAV